MSKLKIIAAFFLFLLPVLALAEDLPGAEDAGKWIVNDILLGDAIFWVLIAVFIVTAMIAAMPNARITWGAPLTIMAVLFVMYIGPWVMTQVRDYAKGTTTTYVETISTVETIS